MSIISPELIKAMRFYIITLLVVLEIVICYMDICHCLLSLKKFSKECNRFKLFSTANNRKGPKTNRDKMFTKILESVDYNRMRSPPPTSLENDPLIPLVNKIVKAADSRKAADILGQ